MTDCINEIYAPDGALIKYRIIRSGRERRAIVMLHGLASNMTRWYEFAEQTRLKDGWDIILPDLRGSGSSVHRGRINMDKWCGDIAAILDREGYGKAITGGHCLGANIAINFAALYPERCAGLILLEPMFSQTFSGLLKKISRHKILLSLLISTVRFFNSIGIYRRSMPLLDLRELDREGRRLIEEAGTPEVLAKRYGSPVYDLRYMPVAAYLQSLRELIHPLPDMREFLQPVFFIFSSGRLFSDTEYAEKLCSSMKDAETVLIDSYHWIPTEKPLELRETIEQWCTSRFE